MLKLNSSRLNLLLVLVATFALCCSSLMFAQTSVFDRQHPGQRDGRDRRGLTER